MQQIDTLEIDPTFLFLGLLLAYIWHNLSSKFVWRLDFFFSLCT